MLERDKAGFCAWVRLISLCEIKTMLRKLQALRYCSIINWIYLRSCSLKAFIVVAKYVGLPLLLLQSISYY